MAKSWITAALILSVSASLLLADEPAKPAGKSDKELLQGTWRVVGMVRNGEDTPEDDLKQAPISMRFAGDVATLSKGDRSRDASFAVDETKTPRQIIITPKDGPEKDKARAHIYLLSGDALKLAFRIGDETTAPADFAQGDGLGMMTLERQVK